MIHNLCIIPIYIQQQWEQTRTNVMKLVYTHNKLLHVLSKHVATFIRDVKYKRYIHISMYKMKLQYQNHLVNETNLVHNILSIFLQFYLWPRHISELSRSIVRRNNCIYTTLGNLLFCVASCLVCRMEWNCTPDSYKEYQNTKCRTNTVVPPDDGPGEFRNM
jgi:hypothetical protein